MFPSIVSNIPEIVGKYPEGTIERQYPTSNPVTKPLRMAVVERAGGDARESAHTPCAAFSGPDAVC